MKTETQEHIELALWLDHNEFLWLHVPNEGEREVGTKVLLKRLGLKKGAPDILIFDHPPGKPQIRGVAIELKRLDGGTRPVEQKTWLAALRKRGWKAEFCNGRAEAVNFLKTLGFKERALRMLEPMP